MEGLGCLLSALLFPLFLIGYVWVMHNSIIFLFGASSSDATGITIALTLVLLALLFILVMSIEG